MAMTPYYANADAGITLYHGDCLEILPKLEAGSVDCVLTDPPYGVEYADWDVNMPSQTFLDECLRVATGQVIWFGAAPMILGFAQYSPQPGRLLVWSPRFTLSHTGSNGYCYRWHPIATWRLQKQSHNAWDIFDDPTECGNWWMHPATKPASLLERLAKTCGQTILDPFTGSGTTGVACIRTGRRFIGIEIEEKYCEIAAKRIERELAQPMLPCIDKLEPVPQRELFQTVA